MFIICYLDICFFSSTGCAKPMNTELNVVNTKACKKATSTSNKSINTIRMKLMGEMDIPFITLI